MLGRGGLVFPEGAEKAEAPESQQGHPPAPCPCSRVRDAE